MVGVQPLSEPGARARGADVRPRVAALGDARRDARERPAARMSSGSSSSSQASGVATGAPGSARSAYGATVVCRRCCARRRRARARRASPCARRSSARPAGGAASGSAISPRRRAPRRPRAPPQRRHDVQAAGARRHREGARPSREQGAERERAGADRGEVRRGVVVGRVEVEEQPAGRSGRSARLVQACGVMQFWFASQTSAASPPTAWQTCRRGGAGPHSPDPVRRALGISCSTTTSLSMPLFQRHRFSGGRARAAPSPGATAA